MSRLSLAAPTTAPARLVSRSAAARFPARRGAVLVRPVVGEQVTSLDMAGVSLSILFLDEELEELWTQPTDTPAFRSGSLTGRAAREVAVEDDHELVIEPGSHDSIAQAAL